jgi:hypothetical protein
VEEGVEISEKEEAFLFNLEDKDETFGRWRSGEVDGRGRRACSAELCHGVTCDMTCKDLSCVPVQPSIAVRENSNMSPTSYAHAPTKICKNKKKI